MLTSNLSCTSFKTLASFSSETNVIAKPLVPKRPARATFNKTISDQNRYSITMVFYALSKKKDLNQQDIFDDKMMKIKGICLKKITGTKIQKVEGGEKTLHFHAHHEKMKGIRQFKNLN